MEQKLLYPLLDTLAKERRQDAADLSAANIVAWRMLRSPYLGDTYASYYLAQTAPGDWRLFQDWHGEAKDRDPLSTFYYDGYMEYEDDETPPDIFVVHPRKRTIDRPQPIQAEEGIDAALLAYADQLMERVYFAYPAALQRLFSPTLEQQRRRQELSIVEVDGSDLGQFLRSKLGDFYDGSLKSSGIDYHSPHHFSHKSLYLVACNDDEVAGVLKLGASRSWGYGLSYVSVAPGFRQQGLSKQLYQRALDVCERDQRVFVRSSPGEFTRDHPSITASYDRMVKASPALHADTESPFLRLFETCIEKGMDYAQMRERFKPHCDAATPTLADRQAGRPDWQQRQEQFETVRLLLEPLQELQPPKQGRSRPR